MTLLRRNKSMSKISLLLTLRASLSYDILIYKWRLIYGLNEALIPFATHEHHNDLQNSLSVLHGI